MYCAHALSYRFFLFQECIYEQATDHHHRRQFRHWRSHRPPVVGRRAPAAAASAAHRSP
ncbi:hypothetical protein ACSHWC_17575 [Pseudomonas fluorescens]